MLCSHVFLTSLKLDAYQPDEVNIDFRAMYLCRMKLCLSAMLVMALFVFAASCTYENVETRFPKGNINCDSITYKKHIKPVIDTRCTTKGCHESGSKNGDFTTYNLMAPKIAKFSNRLLVLQDMPQNGALTPLELESFDCWLQKGAPNN